MVEHGLGTVQSLPGGYQGDHTGLLARLWSFRPTLVEEMLVEESRDKGWGVGTTDCLGKDVKHIRDVQEEEEQQSNMGRDFFAMVHSLWKDLLQFEQFSGLDLMVNFFVQAPHTLGNPSKKKREIVWYLTKGGVPPPL